MNCDFINTDSYSKELIYISKYYKRFGNISFRTVEGKYLIAMKIKSNREYRHDISDVLNIIKAIKENEETISFDDINNAYYKLYGTNIDSLDMIDEIKDAINSDKENIQSKVSKKYEIENNNYTILKSILENNDSMAMINDDNVSALLNSIGDELDGNDEIEENDAYFGNDFDDESIK